jgi:hypothetical protein
MAMPHQRLTIFQDDDVTPILGTVDGSGNVTVPTAITDPTGARPYMIRILDQGEASVDFIEGTATVGAINAQLLDKRITASDQTSGWFTAQLSGSNGQSKLIGRRILIEQQDETASTWYVLMDGVIGDVALDDDLVTYSIATKDIRDRERKTRAFTKSAGLSIFPRGFINGYGKYGADMLNININLLSSVVRPMNATFRMDPTGGNVIGVATIDGNPVLAEDYAADLASVSYMTQKFKNLDTYASAVALGRGAVGSLLSTTYGNIKIHWRARGSGGAYTILADMPVIAGTTFSSSPSAFVYKETTLSNPFWMWQKVTKSDMAWVMSAASSASLPTDGQLIEILVEYVGVPTDQYPLYIEKPMGQLLKDLYDGVYSDEPTRIRYNTTTMAALVAKLPYARVKITEPVDDIREWTETNIYKPTGYAPALDQFGKISPVNYTLPDSTVTPFQLDDTNIVEGGARWVHSSERVANKVTFKYKREYLLPAEAFNGEIASGIGERDVEFTDIHTSVGLLGDHAVEYEPETIRAIGHPVTGAALNGQIIDETGPKLAQARALDLFDRFGYGVQEMEIKAQRRDAAVAAAKVGDWAYVASSWMPNYATGKRGINRIAQIIAIKDVDPASRTFTLLDGGPNSTPVGAPTIGTLTNSGSSVLIPINSIPAGLYVNVEYAVASTQPAANSAAWMFCARADTVSSVKTPLLPPGATVWARARGVGENRRPSAWVYSASVNTLASPAVSNMRVELVENQAPIVRWTSGVFAAGVRIQYAVYAYGAAIPTSYTTFPTDFAATAEVATLTGVNVTQWQSIVIKITPYSSFSGGVASGTAGAVETIIASRIDADYILPTISPAPSATTTTATMVLTPTDPQFRITQVEFKTWQDTTVIQDWTVVAKSGNTYTQTVPIVAGKVSKIEWRVTAKDRTNTATIIETKSHIFAVGSPPTASIDFVSETDTDVTLSLNGSLGTGTSGSLTWKWRTNAGAYTTPSTAALPQQITVSRSPKAIKKVQLIITGPDGQTAEASFAVQGVLVGILTADGKLDRTVPFSQGGYGVKANDTNGHIIDTNVTDSRPFLINQMFRYGTDTTTGAVEVVDRRFVSDNQRTGAGHGFSHLDNLGLVPLAQVGGSGVKASAVARRAGIFFSEAFDALPSSSTGWTVLGAGTLSLQPNEAEVGTSVVRSTGYTLPTFTEKLPYNPTKLYRIRARARRVTAPSSGSNSLYIGLRCFDRSGAATNTNSGYAYVCASAQNPALGVWTLYTGWFKGATASTAGTPGPSTDPRSPSALNIGTSYISPAALLGFNAADGAVELDYIQIDEMDEDAQGRIYASVQSDNITFYSTMRDSRPFLINDTFRRATDSAASVLETATQSFVHQSYVDGSRRPISVRDTVASVDRTGTQLNDAYTRSTTGLDGSGYVQTGVNPAATIAGGPWPASAIVRRAGHLFSETWENALTSDAWTLVSGGNNGVVATATSTGKQVLRSSSSAMDYRSTARIPFNPTKLYRVRIRVSLVDGGTLAIPAQYAGVACYDSNGALLQVVWVCMNGATPSISNGWVTYTGWMKGAGAPFHPANDPRTPSPAHSSTAFISAAFALNYPGGGTSNGETWCDFIDIDEYDEDSSGRVYKALTFDGAIASTTKVYSNAIARIIAKGYQRTDLAQDGTTVTFADGGFAGVPYVSVRGGITYEPRSGQWSNGYNSALPQYQQLYAQNVTASSCQIRAKLRQKAATTARSNNFPTQTITGPGSTNAVTVTNAPSNDNSYTVRGRVTVKCDTLSFQPVGSRAVEIILESNDGVTGWIERYRTTKTASRTTAGNSSLNFDLVATVNVTGLDSTDQFRWTMLTDTPSGGDVQTNQSTFTPNNGSNNNALPGVTYSTSSGDSFASMTPDGDDALTVDALEVNS